MTRRIVFILFLLCIGQVLFAQDALIISDSTTSVDLCRYTAVFRDASRHMSFKDVQKQHFIPVNKPEFQYAFSRDIFWFRFQIRNESGLNENNWYLLWSNALVDNIDVYVPGVDGTYKVQKGGLLVADHEKSYQGPFPLYKIGFLPEKKNLTFFVRLKADETILGSLRLMSHQVYIDQIPKTFAMMWLVIGIQLLRVLYNIVLAWYIRNGSFRWYSFHTVIVTLSVLGSFGLIGGALNDFPRVAGIMNSSFYLLMPATYTLFIFSLLNVWKNYRKIRWLFVTIIIISAGQVLAHVVVPRSFLLQSNTYVFLSTVFLLTATTVDALLRRLSFNAYLLIPCFITLIPFTFLNLQALGLINFGWIYPMIYATNFLEIFALSLVIGKVIQATEKERFQTEKALLTEKLEAEKLVELDHIKTQFFTNISHEFRTPLTLLMGPLEEMRQKYPNEHLIPMMQRNTTRLQALINQLLDLTKLQAGEFKVETHRGDIVSFLSCIFSSFESLAQSQQIHFFFKQSHTSLETDFDVDKMEKIVTNLLSNAFKFTPATGKVEVNVIYQVHGTSPSLVMEVNDTGIGIDAQKLPRIFDRFYQADDSPRRDYEGTGIGLALVRELVELLKGNIGVESEAGAGTCFRLTLPLVVNPQTASETLPLMSPAERKDRDAVYAPGQSHTEQISNASLPILLIVEDNVDLRIYLKDVFDGQYQVVEAVDGQDGLDSAFEIIPDLVVTDLMMPRLDGFSFCQRLKSDERTSHIPVVMLTAKVALADRLEGFGLGADDYLEKPFSKDELLVRVKNLIQQRILLREKFTMMPAVPLGEPVSTARNLDNHFIVKARNVVTQHLSDSSFSADTFSDLMGMSRSNLHRKVKALTGQTTTEFVRTIRLHKASELLAQKNLTVSEVAYQVGFESLSYFSKTFQEQFGVTPSTITLS